MTDKQMADINKIVEECRYRQQGIVCRMLVAPCARVIDKGICPEIIDYLQKQKAESEAGNGAGD